MSQTNFDPKDFRRALSQFPTGVTVMTTIDAQGEPIGMTASSFNSVSLDPALILWSIDKGAHSLSAFQDGKHFAVNVLGRHQSATSNNFARRGEDKFANVSYHEGLGGVPVLDDYAAQFECKTWATYEGGDHVIVVGEVMAYRYQDTVEPLVFARGSYAQSSHLPQNNFNAEDTQDFISDYLLYLLRSTYQKFSAKLYPVLHDKCGVSPEEWRILSRLIAHPKVSVTELSVMVMQPENALRVTADQLTTKGFIEFIDTDTVQVTSAGAKVAESLQKVATEEEAMLLSKLGAKEAEALKENLVRLNDLLR